MIATAERNFGNAGHRQQGTLLVELLVVVAILAIMAALAAPDMRTIMREHYLKSAQDTLVQSLRKAKYVARSNGTTVTVTIGKGEHEVRLVSDDNTVSDHITLPRSITVSDNVEIVFKPIGTVTGAGNIDLISSTGTDTSGVTVTVTVLGAFASI